MPIDNDGHKVMAIGHMSLWVRGAKNYIKVNLTLTLIFKTDKKGAVFWSLYSRLNLTCLQLKLNDQLRYFV
jgi:hypothetical protein